MTGAVVYRLNRHRDVSGVSGEGYEKATVVEFSSGLSVLHWNSDKPSIQVHTDIRHITDHHGHGGASELELYEGERLLAAYKRVLPYLLSGLRNPEAVGPHPNHPDRLLLVFAQEANWRFWIGLLEGSTHAAVHEDIAGETEHRWVSADGNLWLVFHTRHTTKYSDNSPYDDRD